MLLYSQNRTGYTFHAQAGSLLASTKGKILWNWNATVDSQGQYWANYVETGPGIKVPVRRDAGAASIFRKRGAGCVPDQSRQSPQT